MLPTTICDTDVFLRVGESFTSSEFIEFSDFTDFIDVIDFIDFADRLDCSDDVF